MSAAVTAGREPIRGSEPREHRQPRRDPPVRVVVAAREEALVPIDDGDEGDLYVRG